VPPRAKSPHPSPHAIPRGASAWVPAGTRGRAVKQMQKKKPYEKGVFEGWDLVGVLAVDPNEARID
jgi:hypothetical protein